MFLGFPLNYLIAEIEVIENKKQQNKSQNFLVRKYLERTKNILIYQSLKVMMGSLGLEKNFRNL